MSARRRKRGGSAHNVGLLIDAELGYQRSIIAGVLQFLHEHPNWTLIQESGHDEEVLRYLLQQERIEGLIAESRPAVEFARRLRPEIPLVLVMDDGLPQPGGPCPRVVYDEEAVCRMAYAFLRSLGYRSYAFSGWPGFAFSDRRQAGFTAAVAAAGFSCKSYAPTAAHDVYHWDPFVSGLGEWIRTLPDATAVFAACDRAAMRFLRAARAVGRLVPEELALLGVDNDILATTLSSPSLSSIDNGALEVGYRAGLLLKRLLAGEATPKADEVVPPVGIVERHSTDCLAIEDEVARQALRLIREKGCEDCLNVAYLVDRLRVSRRTLETRFVRAVGRTLQQEILRIRMERATTMLAQTSMKTSDIAADCALTSASRLSTLFRQRLGLTPMAFRRERHAGPASGCQMHGLSPDANISAAHTTLAPWANNSSGSVKLAPSSKPSG